MEKPNSKDTFKPGDTVEWSGEAVGQESVNNKIAKLSISQIEDHIREYEEKLKNEKNADLKELYQNMLIEEKQEMERIKGELGMPINKSPEDNPSKEDEKPVEKTPEDTEKDLKKEEDEIIKKLNNAEKERNEEEYLKLEKELRAIEKKRGVVYPEKEQPKEKKEEDKTEERPVPVPPSLSSEKQEAPQKPEVEKENLKKIAEKRMNGTALTEEEQAILKNKEKEIEMIVSDLSVEKARRKYAEAYQRFLNYKDETTNYFTKTYRKITGHKYKEEEMPSELKRLKEEYNEALSKKGNNLYLNKKEELEKTKISKEELKEKLQHFVNNNIYNEIIVNEQKILAESKAEGWPPKEKSVLRKGVEWYMKQPRIRKLIISSVLSTIAFAAFAPGAALAVGSMTAVAATKFVRGFISAGVGQFAAKAYDFLIKDKTKQKREEEERELGKYFSDEKELNESIKDNSNSFIDANRIAYVSSEHEKIIDREEKRKRNRLFHKAMVAATAGGAASISTTNLTLGFSHPKTVYADNTGYGEQKYTVIEPEIRKIPIKPNLSEIHNEPTGDASYTQADQENLDKINSLREEIENKYSNHNIHTNDNLTPSGEDLPYEEKQVNITKDIQVEPNQPYYRANPAGMEIKEGQPYYRANPIGPDIKEGQPYYRATPPNVEQINNPQDYRTVRIQAQETENQPYQRQNGASMLREEDQPYYKSSRPRVEKIHEQTHKTQHGPSTLREEDQPYHKPTRGTATGQQYNEPQKLTTTGPKIIEAEQTTGTNKNIPIEFFSKPGETANQTVQRMIETNPRLAESMGWDHQSELRDFAISASSGSQVLIENPVIASSLSSHNILEMFKYDVERAIWTPEKLSDEAYGVLLDKHFGGYDIEYVRGINSDAWSRVQNWNASDIFDKKIKIPNEYDNFTKEIRSLSAETGLVPNAASNESWAEFYKRLIKYKLTH